MTKIIKKYSVMLKKIIQGAMAVVHRAQMKMVTEVIAATVVAMRTEAMQAAIRTLISDEATTEAITGKTKG
jgi:hypothetical protein